MAHEAQQNFIHRVKTNLPSFFNDVKVLEVGSGNINGTVRGVFTNTKMYIGLDLAPGDCVDVICSGHIYDTDERFDISISTECFEHDEHWHETFLNMVRLTKSGGLIVFTCASYDRPEHGTQRTTPQDSLSSHLSDYYKNLGPTEFESSINMKDIFSDYAFEVNKAPSDLYFWGLKK